MQKSLLSTVYKGLVSFAVAVMLLPAQVWAQGSPPPPPPTDGSGPPCWPPPCIPIDNGTIFLLAAGALFGGWLLLKMQDKRAKVA